MSMSVCVFVCPRGYLRNHTRDLHLFLCMLPMSVAWSSSGMLTIGRIAYRREGDDGCAQRWWSVISDCLVFILVIVEICATQHKQYSFTCGESDVSMTAECRKYWCYKNKLWLTPWTRNYSDMYRHRFRIMVIILYLISLLVMRLRQSKTERSPRNCV